MWKVLDGYSFRFRFLIFVRFVLEVVSRSLCGWLGTGCEGGRVFS